VCSLRSSCGPWPALNRSFGLDTWVFRRADWHVPDRQRAHVARESATVRFEPQGMTNLDVTHPAANKGAIARHPSAN
jgi:hypothetical protein